MAAQSITETESGTDDDTVSDIASKSGSTSGSLTGSGDRGAARLAARGVTVGYAGRTVIDGLDVSIPPGVITTIIGPNGCGKSTLLRTLTRLLKAGQGHGRARR